ncbi:unnamed protein product [Trypanosoma congolense IL3000]|uniref:WGS project CAEQ00000000 data, annotated contig 1038 n=1 Tax=Trypanosoma congolense (strain IL3000) TaxID=1068625 RepID=F9W3C8_TRYCI|nr:unnamed protein product [Trypanosoma congolense IL3000]
MPQGRGKRKATGEANHSRKRQRGPSPTLLDPSVEDTRPPRRIPRLVEDSPSSLLEPAVVASPHGNTQHVVEDSPASSLDTEVVVMSPPRPPTPPTPPFSIPRKSFLLWTMQSDLGVVLMELSGDPRRLNLYDFFKPAYPHIQPPLRPLTLADFLGSPKACHVAPYPLEEVLQSVPQLRKAMREKMLLRTWQLSSRNVLTLEDWARRGTYELVEPLPRMLLDEAVWKARPQPWPSPAGVRTATPPSSGRNPCVLHLPPRRPPKAWTVVSPIEDVLREGCDTWADVPLAEFLLEEYGFPVRDSARPRGSLYDFLENPTQHLRDEEAREQLLQKMQARLEDLRTRFRGDAEFLRLRGLTILGRWPRTAPFRDVLTWATKRILAVAWESCRRPAVPNLSV